MTTSSFATLLAVFASIISLATSGSVHGNFLECLRSDPSMLVYTPNTSSYSSILQFSIRNLRFSSSATLKPVLIVTPLNHLQVQAAVICSRRNGVQVKIRSGGHDSEGLSYTSDVPFVMLDLINLASVRVDVDGGTAWVQAGATLGKVYYRIAEKSGNYGFPAGVCPTVGIGGHVSGGGYGSLMRKYGLAADNILDAWIVNADGEILNRKTMGEELFWAIRGGGAASFCVVLSWKIKLVPVPSTVTVFKLLKNLEQGATSLVQRWQYVVDKLPQDLFIQIVIDVANSTRKGERTIQATFQSLFLGKVEQLIPIMKQHFPELGLKREDCNETSWIRSTLLFGGLTIDSQLNVLLNRTPSTLDYFKSKADYVTEPIPEVGLKGMWQLLLKENRPQLLITPYGGRMSEIPEFAIPFPHRKGNIYSILQVVYWDDEDVKMSKEHIDWVRRLYKYLTPYVSKSPRAGYINYRDIDLGQSKNGTTSYSEAKRWGNNYFKNNFDRLVRVKTNVDPGNFFRNEQSIPTWAWKNESAY